MRQEKCVHDLKEHSKEIYTLEMESDGMGTSNPNQQLVLASSSFDSTVKLWDVELGKLKHSLNGHKTGDGSGDPSSSVFLMVAELPGASLSGSPFPVLELHGNGKPTSAPASFRPPRRRTGNPFLLRRQRIVTLPATHVFPDYIDSLALSAVISLIPITGTFPFDAASTPIVFAWRWCDNPPGPATVLDCSKRPRSPYEAISGRRR
ncbi:hypothetical protein MLD38_030292 [Melastoma candidum]|uniref:Uncharacterized protein n=1 Tax=Melastoma candidum TaxID=119954 RepID=A0ACB9MLT7_9MYRT|nr:hypothetical protein MLD38_030292 [Melastoma candidum]